MAKALKCGWFASFVCNTQLQTKYFRVLDGLLLLTWLYEVIAAPLIKQLVN